MQQYTYVPIKVKDKMLFLAYRNHISFKGVDFDTFKISTNQNEKPRAYHSSQKYAPQNNRADLE